MKRHIPWTIVESTWFQRITGEWQTGSRTRGRQFPGVVEFEGRTSLPTSACFLGEPG